MKKALTLILLAATLTLGCKRTLTTPPIPASAPVTDCSPVHLPATGALYNSGTFVIRNHTDWQNFFLGTGFLPPDPVDFSQKMLLVIDQYYSELCGCLDTSVTISCVVYSSLSISVDATYTPQSVPCAPITVDLCDVSTAISCPQAIWTVYDSVVVPQSSLPVSWNITGRSDPQDWVVHTACATPVPTYPWPIPSYATPTVIP